MKTNIFKYIFYSILLILIILAIYFLYKDDNNKSLALEEKNTNLNIQEDINIGIEKFDTINPLLTKNKEIQYITKLVFDPLIDITKDFQTENKLAKEISKINSTTYIIKLKENILWHDNTKFTAKDVLFTINNLKQTDSIYKENIKEISQIEKLDDFTIKIILEKEVPFFEYNLCFPILCANAYEEDTLESKIDLPVGTGEYLIQSIEENKIVLSLREGLENRIKRINVIVEKDTSNLFYSFSKDKLDYIVTNNLDYESVLGTMGYNVQKVPGREFDYLVLNCNHKYLQNKELRKTINSAIDKNSINYNVFNNKYNICDFPLYNSYLIDTLANTQNNVKSKEYKFNLVVNKENENRCKVAEQIKDQLEKIGIKINVLKVNNYSYKNYLKNKNYDMILTGRIISNSPNLETYFGEDNLSNFNSMETKQLLKDINNMGESEVLKEKYLDFYNIYTEEMPFISLYSNSIFILSSKNLKGDMSCNWYNLFYNINKWYKVN